MSSTYNNPVNFPTNNDNIQDTITTNTGDILRLFKTRYCCI